MTFPLSGVRILDLSRILAGPWATQNLADLGAEVIKVERPGVGDDTRTWGPPFVQDPKTGAPGDAAYYFACNRGKKSVTIDIAHPEGQTLIRELAAQSDILVENYKVGGLRKYGLDYASLREVNRRLVYCSITGFGQTGPYRQRAGYDFLIQAMGGLMSVTGERDDLPGGGPQKAGVALADVLTGMYSTIAILAALRQRDATGEGQHIDMALLDVQVAALANQAATYLLTGSAPKRIGNGHAAIVPYQSFPTSDGHIILAIGNDEQFAKFCKAAEATDLGTERDYRTNAGRVQNRERLIERMRAITRQRTTDQWIALMERVGVPCGPINTIDRVFADPQVRARGMQVELPHTRLGAVSTVRSPMRFSESESVPSTGPPVLGEHTEVVLRDLLGRSEAAVAKLRRDGVV